MKTNTLWKHFGCVVIVLLSTVLSPVIANTPLKGKTLSSTNMAWELDCTNGSLSLFQGRTLEAMRQLKKGADEIAQGAIDSMPEAMCVMFLGLTYHSAGQFDLAAEAYLPVHAYFAKVDDVQMQATLQFGLGSVYMMQGRLIEAHNTLSDTIELLKGNKKDWAFPNLKPLLLAATLNNHAIVVVTGLSTGIEKITETPKTFNFEDALINLTDSRRLLQEVAQSIPDQGDPIQQLIDEIAKQLGLSPAQKQQMSLLVNTLGLSEQLTEEDKAMLQILLPLLQTFNSKQSTLNVDEIFESIAGGALNSLIFPLAASFEPIVVNNIGEAYRVQDMFDEALDHYAEAEELIAALDTIGGEMAAATQMFGMAAQGIVNGNRGLIHLQKQEWKAAIDEFEKSQAILVEEMGNSFAAINIHTNLGFAYRKVGDDLQAKEQFEAAMDLLDTIRSISEGSVVRFSASKDFNTLDMLGMQGTLAQYPDVYAWAIDTYRSLGMDKEAFVTSERSRARLFRDMIAQTQVSGEIGEFLRQTQDAYYFLQFAQSTSKTQANLKPINRSLLRYWQREVKDAQAAYNKTLSALQSLNPEVAVLAAGVSFSLDVDKVQANLADSQSTLVAYYLTEGAVISQEVDLALAWVLDGTKINLVELGARGDELRKLTFELRNNIAFQYQLSDSSNQDSILAVVKQFETTSDLLYNALLAQVLSLLETDNSKESSLILIPHGSLHYLPFAALRDGKSGHYLLEEHPFSISVSADSLLQTSTTSLTGTLQALVLANPDQTLASVVREAEAVADQFESTLLIGDKASETFLISNTISADILHIAAHGNFDQNEALESYLKLQADGINDGYLEAGEIIALDLQETQLVVLSACETAIGEVSRGDEVTGLTRSFHLAGIPTVISSLWNVDDESTRILMTQFYQNISAGQPILLALRNAQLQLLQTEEYQQPYYWAVFQLYGIGS